MMRDQTGLAPLCTQNANGTPPKRTITDKAQACLRAPPAKITCTKNLPAIIIHVYKLSSLEDAVLELGVRRIANTRATGKHAFIHADYMRGNEHSHTCPNCRMHADGMHLLRHLHCIFFPIQSR